MLAVPPLSEAWLDRLDEVSREVLDVSDLRGAKLAAALAHVSLAYTEQRQQLDALRGDEEALCARLKFFLPRDLLKVHGPLAELHAARALPKRAAWRVLDLGAGLGTTSLGIARFAALTGTAERLLVTAVDVDEEALALYAELARDVSALPAAPIALNTRAFDLRQPTGALSAKLSPPYDFITLGLALNELRDGASDERAAGALAAERLMALSHLLTDDGVLLVIEPALRETSRVLHAARDLLAARNQRPYVFAPCVRSAACPMLTRPRDYCHERVPYALPARLAELSAAAGLRDSDLTYSYLTLHAAKRSLAELHGAGAGALYRAVSGPLPSKGKLEVWLCGECGAPRAMRLDRHTSEANAALGQAGRGTLLQVSGSPSAEPERLRIGPETQVAVLSRWGER